jgi:hypothetical protein
LALTIDSSLREGPLGLFSPALPLAHELRLHIQVAGEHGLADAGLLAHGLDFAGGQLFDRA